MHRSWGLLIATLVLALAPGAGRAAGAGCVPGTAATAAVTLFGKGTELARFDRVAGLRTALVLEPYIAPGTRHRMIAIDGGWCDAERAFNRAWAANGLTVGDGAAMAAAYAQLAAAPYFDQTTVTSQRSALGSHVLTTHALTNGVAAAWTIVTDAGGVRTARWAETAYAVELFVAQWEGLTAVDGASERYARAADGDLLAGHGLPSAAMAGAPAAEVSYTGPDGFKIVIGIGDTRQGVDADTDTGFTDVDVLRMTRAVMAENYEDFYKWGFRADWATARTRPGVINSPVSIPAPAKTGYVSIDDATSAYCQACVFIADDFQIHFVSHFREFAEALGYSYPGASDKDVLNSVLGHEMFHDWQNNYTKPDRDGRSVPGSYSEGTARFQQALHRYSGIEHQAKSLIYANDVNGCNGFAGTPPDVALAAGAFESPSYSACNFWLGWYGAEGLPALVKLVTTGMAYDKTVTTLTNAEKVMGGIVTATGKPYVESAAEWSAALITRKNLTWADPVNGGAAIDWATHLERWTPAAAAVGTAPSRTLANGGVMAVRVTGGAFVPSVTAGAKLAILRDSATGSSLSYPAAGETVPAAADGETLYAIAVWPAKGSRSTKITLTPA